MEEKNKIERRGGRREGAGRPHSDSKLYTFRAPGQMARFLDAQDNKTEFIKNCIVRQIHAQDANIRKMEKSILWHKLRIFACHILMSG